MFGEVDLPVLSLMTNKAYHVFINGCERQETENIVHKCIKYEDTYYTTLHSALGGHRLKKRKQIIKLQTKYIMHNII